MISLHIGASVLCLFIDGRAGRTWNMLLWFSPGFIKIYNQHILVAGSKLLLESSEVYFKHLPTHKLIPNYLPLVSIQFELFFTYNTCSKLDCQYCCFFLISKKHNETINTSSVTAVWEARGALAVVAQRLISTTPPKLFAG